MLDKERDGADENLFEILSRNDELNRRKDLPESSLTTTVLIKVKDRGKEVVEAENVLNNNCYGWDKYIDNVTVYDVCGTHYTLFDESNIKDLCVLLRKILDWFLN